MTFGHNQSPNDTNQTNATTDVDYETDDDIPRQQKSADKKRHKEMAKLFRDEARIRHVIQETNHTWVGIFNLKRRQIVHKRKHYNNLLQFARAHLEIENLGGRKVAGWGWAECEVEVDGKWVFANKVLSGDQ